MKTDTKNPTTVFSRWMRFLGVLLCAGLTVALMVPTVAFSQSYANPAPIPLLTAGTYGALAYGGITGTANVNGDVGSSNSTAGVGIAAINGQKWPDGGQHNLDAQTDLGKALDTALSIIKRPSDSAITTSVLGGLTLQRGVYDGGALDLAVGATLTLYGSATDVFIIRASSTLTINNNGTVALGGGAVWSNVFWYVGSSATLNTGSTFNGIILAVSSISNTGASLVTGRLLAHTGAITLSSNVLPVELVSFTATANGMNTNLHWSTATEINNSGFEIQRRQTSDWSKVGFVAGAGTSNAPRNYSYTDSKLSAGSYAYRLKQIDNNGAFTYGSTVEVAISSAPAAFALSQNYPNPFNPSTVISYSLEKAGMVSLRVYNMLGQEVATLVNGPQEAGIYAVSFNTSKGTLGLSSGVYVYRLEAGSFISTKKLVLMK